MDHSSHRALTISSPHTSPESITQCERVLFCLFLPRLDAFLFYLYFYLPFVFIAHTVLYFYHLPRHCSSPPHHIIFPLWSPVFITPLHSLPPPLQPHITTTQHSLPHVTENNAPHHHHSHHPLSPLDTSKHHHPSHHPLSLPLFTTPHQHSQHLIIIITALKSASPLFTTPHSITIHSTNKTNQPRHHHHFITHITPSPPPSFLFHPRPSSTRKCTPK